MLLQSSLEYQTNQIEVLTTRWQDFCFDEQYSYTRENRLFLALTERRFTALCKDWLQWKTEHILLLSTVFGSLRFDGIQNVGEHVNWPFTLWTVNRYLLCSVILPDWYQQYLTVIKFTIPDLLQIMCFCNLIYGSPFYMITSTSYKLSKIIRRRVFYAYLLYGCVLSAEFYTLNWTKVMSHPVFQDNCNSGEWL